MLRRQLGEQYAADPGEKHSLGEIEHEGIEQIADQHRQQHAARNLLEGRAEPPRLPPIGRVYKKRQQEELLS